MEERKVTLKINGKEIPLNSFVKEFISSTIIGMVSSLKWKKEEIQEIEIAIGKKNEDKS
ncbi:MAG: hypothetical protein ACUVUG_09115 [Candidatus Aminicenantia bacterium]